MGISIQKWGNSHAFRIPKNIINEADIKENDVFEMSVKNGNIIIEKVFGKRPKPSITIEELFEGFSGEVEKIDIDWGEPQGDELW